jgi:chemotaxis protein CheX
MKAEYINPFLKAFDNVIQQIMNIKAEMGSIFLKEGTQKSGEVVITIGVTGDLGGSVVLSMSENTGKALASKMMFGMEVPELNDMAKSAIAELGNMVAGNSAGYFHEMGLKIDITPPTLYTGSNISVYAHKSKTLCVPMTVDNETIEIDVSLT